MRLYKSRLRIAFVCGKTLTIAFEWLVLHGKKELHFLRCRTNRYRLRHSSRPCPPSKKFFFYSVWASVLSKISLVGFPASTPPSHPSATPSFRSDTSTASNGVLFTLWQIRHPLLFISVFLPPNFKLKWETWEPVHLSDLRSEGKVVNHLVPLAFLLENGRGLLLFLFLCLPFVIWL